MKKTIKCLLVSMASLSLILSGCGENNPNGSKNDPCVNHIDMNDDGKCDVCNEDIPSESEMIFEGITFGDETVAYDGKAHSIEAKGVPSFATVTYVGNGQKDVGTYHIKATVTAHGYEDLTMNAFLTITGNNFDNITFSNATVEYDGENHSIYVTGAPDFATVTYTGNNQKSVGKHTVKASISAPGYYPKTLTAYLTITAKKFTGITFSDETIAYDGKTHSIYVSGAPSFANVTYEGNGKYARGTYTVKATITATGYETLVLTAKLTIANIFPEIILEDRTLFYDGSEQKIDFKYGDSLPSYTNTTFKINGVEVDADDFKVKEKGTYTVSISLENDTYNYIPSSKTATIKVVDETVGGVDSSKTAFTINENTKYQDLRSEILKNNFTVVMELFDDYDYDKDDIYEKSIPYSKDIIYVTDNEAFVYHDYLKKNDNSLDLDESRFEHYKIVDDELLHSTYVNGILDLDYCEKMPKSAYQENVVAQYGLPCIAYLNESETGGFANGQEGGFTTKYGTFKIDVENNKFIGETNNYFYKTEWNHSEHCKYTIYNIGNTTIDVLDELNLSNLSYDYFQDVMYYENGFRYYTSGSQCTLDVDYDSVSVLYLQGGEIEIPAEINGLMVKNISFSYYYPYYFGEDKLKNFTFKVHFDESGYYQGEYEDYGYVSNYKKIGYFADDGATILYYGEW